MNISCFRIVLLVWISTLWLTFTGYSQNKQGQQHIEVAMRMIGHKLLLQSGDSISRVLPVENEKDRYKITFESPFEFNPDELVTTIDSVVKVTNIAYSYLVEVVECNSDRVVYSYEIGELDKKDVIPCGSRKQPKACYDIVINILESGKTLVIAPKQGNLFMAVSLIVGLLVLAGLLIYFRKKKNKPVIKPDAIYIGKYEFDKNNMLLSYGSDRIELSGKETDLLFLLYCSVNNTVERDVILNAVWGDEGDYVGRTLDVFISKLRKKLEADPEVKIANIRGIGYKLILNEAT